MLPTIHLGPLALQVPGLLLLVGLWLGISLAEKHSTRYRFPANHIYTITISAILSAVVAARLIYVIRYLDNFIENPLNIFSLNPALLDPSGASIGLAVSLFFFTRYYKVDPWNLLDALAPILAVLMVASNLANLASGKGYGYPSDLPWAINLYAEARHPTQIYEMLAAGVILGALWPGSRRAQFRPAGVYALCVIAASAASRLIFDALRADSHLITGGLRSAQVIAWCVLAVALWQISRRARNNGQNIH